MYWCAVLMCESERLDMWCRYAEAQTLLVGWGAVCTVLGVWQNKLSSERRNQNSPELIGSCLRGIVGDLKNAESLIDLSTLLVCCLSWIFVFIRFLFQHHYIVAADRDRWWDPYTFHLKKHLLPFIVENKFKADVKKYLILFCSHLF